MILGLIEHDRGKLNEAVLEMLTLGRRLARQLAVPLEAVLIGEAARPLAGRLAEYGVSTAHLAAHPRLTDYAPAAWAQILSEVAAGRARAVLALGSERGNEVMAHLAARLDLPLAANCTEVQPGDPFLVTRQRWGGTLLEEARLQGAVKLLTVVPQAVAAQPAAPSAEVSLRDFTPALGDKDLRVMVGGRAETDGGKVSLAEARLVVGGGRGVGSAENFQKLDELAGLLSGAVGCSRAVTSLGWRPHADQVGQTGTRIAPELYIACGVSGASQHMVGCKGAKRILAINTDPDAPIMIKATYTVVGDLNQVLPALSAAIRKERGG